MNVFVLCTGRCGSTTFTRACQHFSNFTSGHETRTGRVGDHRLDYPNFHIECDNRLSWLLGRLDDKFGDDAYYVHLTRDPEQVARSYVNRVGFRGSMMDAYSINILLRRRVHTPEAKPIELARDMVATMTSNIRHFLSDKTNYMEMDIEQAQTEFPKFIEWIGAQGDLDSAMKEFDTRHNASQT
ncbi:MAG: hypothetical protein AAF429_01820 [Pseudomonadota bacterium]